MTARKATPLSGRDGIPYAQIYAALRRAAGRGMAAAAEAKPPRWDEPAVVRVFQRIGTVPSSYRPQRAALRVLLAASEMARSHGAPIEEVYATLLALCDPQSPQAVCAERPRCAECPIRGLCRYASHRPTIKELPATERPRERLMAAGPEGMSDAELLAILVGGGSHKESALALAQRLLATFGSLHRLAQASNRELLAIGGIGPARAAQIRAPGR